MSQILGLILSAIIFGQLQYVSGIKFCDVLKYVEKLYTRRMYENNGYLLSKVEIITGSQEGTKWKFVWNLENNMIGVGIELKETSPDAIIVFPQLIDECSDKETDCQQLLKLSSKLISFYKYGSQNYSYEFKQVVDDREENVLETDLPFNIKPKGVLDSNINFKFWPSNEWIKSVRPVATYDPKRKEVIFISTPLNQNQMSTKIWTNSIKSDDWTNSWNKKEFDDFKVQFSSLVTILRRQEPSTKQSAIYGFDNFMETIYEYEDKTFTKIDKNLNQFFGCKEEVPDETNVSLIVLVVVLTVLALIPLGIAICVFSKKTKTTTKPIARLKIRGDDKSYKSSRATTVSSVKTINSITGKPVAIS